MDQMKIKYNSKRFTRIKKIRNLLNLPHKNILYHQEFMLKKLILIITLLFSSLLFSQKKRIEYYNYGQDGMENVYGVKDSMLIYNNFRSRPLIRKEVGDTIARKYHLLKTFCNRSL
jgi:hypothetical protein